MNLTHKDFGDTRVIAVGDSRIDAAVAIQFKDMMRNLTDDAPGRVVLDMSPVEFLDSSGLGAVVAALKQMAQGHALELAALTPTVRKVFSLTRMDTIFKIHDDADDALGGGPANAS